MKNVDDLVPYDNNPRNNEDAVGYVAESIKQFGFKQPIVVDKNNVVVCGHTRLEASKLLKLKEVPCIVADDLSKKQIKAYRLADNKVAEMATWDASKLEIELKDLEIDFDMDEFGFELLNSIDDEQEEKPNARINTIKGYNLDRYDEKETEGYYQMPKLQPIDYVPEDLIGFNYMLTSKEFNKGIHFYVDDYQFERIWNEPDTYIEKLAEFNCTLTPDFSLYREMPIAMKIWNVYRSRLIGQMCQRKGMLVIPTVSWSEKTTFDFCFDGLPKESTLSISTVGVKQNGEAFDIWKDGVDEMIKRLSPKRLLVYGGQVDYDYGDIEVIYYNNHVTERMKEITNEV